MSKTKKVSKKFDLNNADIKRWVMNTLLFSSPAILAFLLALQTGGDWRFAMGAAYSAGLASCIDLVKKFVTENGGGK